MAIALLAVAGAAAAQRSDWERRQEELAWREREVVLPAYPRPENLLPFFVSAATTFDFYIDATSISTGEDGVVRYVLVARSAQGAETVSYEGIRCAEKTTRIYATGAGGQWTLRPTAWRPIEPRSIQRWHNALSREYFCPFGNPIRSAREGVEALRSGDHASRRPISD